MGLPVALHEVVPLRLELPAPLRRLLEGLPGLVRHQERGLERPSQGLLAGGHLVLAQRLAVGLGRPLLAGAAVADHRRDHDERRPVRLRLGRCHRRVQRFEVVAVVHAQHVPAVGLESLPNVL
jgi:hypothetical protein